MPFIICLCGKCSVLSIRHLHELAGLLQHSTDSVSERNFFIDTWANGTFNFLNEIQGIQHKQSA